MEWENNKDPIIKIRASGSQSINTFWPMVNSIVVSLSEQIHHVAISWDCKCIIRVDKFSIWFPDLWILQ